MIFLSSKIMRQQKRTISIIKMYNFQLINIYLDTRSFEWLYA